MKLKKINKKHKKQIAIIKLPTKFDTKIKYSKFMSDEFEKKTNKKNDNQI
jgi:uncharacterized membrane protein YgcG